MSQQDDYSAPASRNLSQTLSCLLPAAAAILVADEVTKAAPVGDLADPSVVGMGDAVTPITDAVSDITNSVSPIADDVGTVVSDIGPVVHSMTALANDVGDVVSTALAAPSSLIGDATQIVPGTDALDPAGLIDDSPICFDCLQDKLSLATDGPILGPVTAMALNTTGDFHSLLEDTGHQLGEPASSVVHSLIDYGSPTLFDTLDSPTGILGAPALVQQGDTSQAVCNVVGSTEQQLGLTGDFVNNVVDAVNLSDPLDTGLVHDVAGDIGSGPLLKANLVDPSGSGASLAGLQVNALSQPGALIALDAAGDGQQSPSNQLITADAGPTANQSTLDVLSNGGAGPGTLGVNAIDTGCGGLQLLDADIGTNPNVADVGQIANALSTDTLPTLPTDTLGCDVPIDIGSIAPDPALQHGLLLI